MKKTNVKNQKRIRRRVRIRAKVSGTSSIPRLAVFKSLKYIYAQLIDDEAGKTLASATHQSVQDSKAKTKTDFSKEVGKDLATKAQKLGISKVVFDRGGFIYTGRVKALAESAREAGLKF